MTPLHLAAQVVRPQSIMDEIVFALKDHGADIKARDDQGMDPLSIAILHGNAVGIRSLVNYGSNINSRDIWERHPSVAQ